MTRRLDLEQARRLWLARQALANPSEGEGAAARAVHAAGWVHCIGGLDLYASVWCRAPEVGGAALEAAVAEEELRIVPGVRGCTMLVPREEVGLALSIGSHLWRKRSLRELAKVGCTPEEIDEVAQAAWEALAGGPLESQALRNALPVGLVRSFGAAGKKIGLSTNLPVALRALESQGRAIRKPVDGRLDSERYVWKQTAAPPGELEEDPARMAAGLARVFLRSAAPGTLDELAAWSGLGKRDSARGLEAVEAESITIDGYADSAWVLPEQLDGLEAEAPEPRVHLVPFRDPYLGARLNLAPLVAEEHRGLEVPGWGRGSTPLGEVKALHLRAVLVDGRVAGGWEWDDEEQHVVAGTFGPLDATCQAALHRATSLVTELVQSEVGHARVYPMEPKTRRPKRLAFVRSLG